ncbi:hypothetical protein L1987_15710 [Smallanthus sonchifolius]|uniref:Uncharacterized protein n=1 Tax=Smallanthus sonchifolius TaxID=185202 RepID=A0ACB9J8F7_9ASTR|nr:hypothetical protein L1987_15710 [Smallanthus sonchifolius]
MITLHEPQFDLEAGRACGGCGGGGGGGDDAPRQSESLDGSKESSTITTEIAGLVLEEVVEKGREMHLLKVEKDCRICHLSLDVNSEESGNGIPIELGCSCKDDLAVAHKHCAEAWFKIKGNRTCEICGSTARNISSVDEVEVIDQWNEPNGSTRSQARAPGVTMATSEAHNFWQGHRFLNILLASMVFAFVISWLFHFNVPS